MVFEYGSVFFIYKSLFQNANNFADSFDEDIEFQPVDEEITPIVNAGKFGFAKIVEEVQVIEEIPVQKPKPEDYDSFDDDDFIEVIDNAKAVEPAQSYYTSPMIGKRHDMHGQFKTYLKDDGDEFMNSSKFDSLLNILKSLYLRTCSWI